MSLALEVNRIVLRVNDRIATLHDFEERKQERLAGLARSSLSEAEKQQQAAGLGAAVMRDIFDELILLSRADQLGFRADKADVEAAMEQTKKSFGITTDEEFDQGLAANGMTRDTFREQIERNLLIRQTLGREVYSQIAIGEEDVRRYYRENPDEFMRPARRRLREVVVLEEGAAAAALEGLAAELQEEIAAGKGDDAVAPRLEEGVSTGWIELGWVDVGDLDPELERALAGLTAGGVSAPTRGRGGLHIIEVLEFENEAAVAFEDVKSAIEAKLRDELFEQGLDAYMSTLEETAYVQSDPPPDAAGFRSRASGPRQRVDPLERQMAAQQAGQAAGQPEVEAEAEPMDPADDVDEPAEVTPPPQD